MTRLPKRYFKSISDYVRAYYTAYGARRAQKLYDAVKTVTKDFTRTDPVYARIGDDGEPEIHYTMTQADGESWFAGLGGLSSSTLYIHNGKILTSATYLFLNTPIQSVVIDSLENLQSMGAFFQGSSAKKVKFINEKMPKLLYFNTTFARNGAITEIPAMDCSAVTTMVSTFLNSSSVTAFKAYGMKVSFDLSSTAINHDAILEVFNNLGTVDATAGITLTLGSEKLALMSDEEKAIATGKGWVLA